MAEWLKASDCNSGEYTFYIGSNPILFKAEYYNWLLSKIATFIVGVQISPQSNIK